MESLVSFSHPVVTDENANAIISDMLMECVEVLGMFPFSTPDPRSWKHLLVYAPKEHDHTFDRLEGKDMCNLRIDELPAYLSAVATNFGSSSPEFLTAAQWVADELQRKTTEEVIAVLNYYKAREQLRAIRAQQEADAGPAF